MFKTFLCVNTSEKTLIFVVVVVVGGFDGSSFLKIVEIYDQEKDCWELGPELMSGRSGHATAVSYAYFPHCPPFDCYASGSSKDAAAEAAAGGCVPQPMDNT